VYIEKICKKLRKMAHGVLKNIIYPAKLVLCAFVSPGGANEGSSAQE
jgi:hypothetical protein